MRVRIDQRRPPFVGMQTRRVILNDRPSIVNMHTGERRSFAPRDELWALVSLSLCGSKRRPSFVGRPVCPTKPGCRR